MKRELDQLLMIDAPKAAWTSVADRLVQRFELAGIWFRTFTGTAPEVCSKCAHALRSRPFLAVEDEGSGSLSALFAPLPHPYDLDAEDARRAGELIGRAMSALGLNLNLAPTVDLAGAAAKPADVAGRAEAFVRGLACHRVLACARHFPGMPAAGSALTTAPVVDRPMATLWREDLLPYRRLGSSVAMVQITHAVHKAYDYEFPRPASFSPSVVEGLLREKLGYLGVALADASAAARATGIDIAEAAVKAVSAGCDLVLVPAEEKKLQSVLTGLERAIDGGNLSGDRVGEALGRIKAAKKRIGKPGNDPAAQDLDRLRQEFAEFRRGSVAGRG